MHTRYVCYWRCPVHACPLWFTSELHGNDHIEHTHHFREGCGHSFYECLRKFGLEWFGSHGFFEQRKVAGQSPWMELDMARRSSQQLRNAYTITGRSDFVPLCKFFKTAGHQLHLLHTGVPDSFRPQIPMLSLFYRMRTKIYSTSTSSDDSPIKDSPVAEYPAPSTDDVPATSSIVEAPVRSLTSANYRSLRFLETGALGSPHVHTVSS